jgi:hypothetical protein
MAVLQTPPDQAEKKTAHAVEQDRPDVLTRRQDWFDRQEDLDPDRLIFIGETSASTAITRWRGRTLIGERLTRRRPASIWSGSRPLWSNWPRVTSRTR